MSVANIHYQVAVATIPGHLFKVQLHIAKPDPKGQIVSLPAWIPGSYLIRDFAKNLHNLTAVDGDQNPLTLEKLDKQRWRLPSGINGATLEYQIYAFDLSVRSAYIADQYAFFNGTSVFLRVEGQEQQPQHVTLSSDSCPAVWQVVSAMPATHTDAHGFGDYAAENYASLIDHPVIIGALDIQKFTVQGVEVSFALAGGHQTDMPRICQDLEKICAYHLDFFGEPAPIAHYCFITLLTDNGYGGLEHSHSTVLMFDRWGLPATGDGNSISDSYRNYLGLCSHEFLHTWNVKRIRPAELAASDLQHEAYTDQLWIYEGFTSYYDDLSLVRCGLITPESYVELLGQNLTRLVRNPGRNQQALRESSFYAWTKFYQQDAGSINHIVSYYTKGAAFALCLDLKLRQVSDGKYSLDDVLRHLWRAHGDKAIPTDPDVIHQLLSSWQIDLNDFLHQGLDTTTELPVQELLADVGVQLHYRASSGPKDVGGKKAETLPKRDFGALFKTTDTSLQITRVNHASAAFDAGLQVGDQLIAVNQWQVTESRLHQLLDNAHGATCQLSVFRDQRLLTLAMPLREAAQDTVYLDIADRTKLSDWHWLAKA